MGRNKIEIRRLDNPSHIKSTFKQRIKGVLNKAKELATLCTAQVALVIISQEDEYYGEFHNCTMNDIVRRYVRHEQSQGRRFIRVGGNVGGGNQPLINPPPPPNSYDHHGNNSQQYMVNPNSPRNNQLHGGPISPHMANMSAVGSMSEPHIYEHMANTSAMSNGSQPHIPQHMANMSAMSYDHQPHHGLMNPQSPSYAQDMNQQHVHYHDCYRNDNKPYGYDLPMGSNGNGFQSHMGPPPRREQQPYEGGDNCQPYGNFPIPNLHPHSIQTHGDLPMGHSTFYERGYQEHEALLCQTQIFM